MDSDHLTEVMRESDERHELEQATTGNRKMSNSRIAQDKDSQDMIIREQIDDDEPTFYNDSTKIELQLQESTGQPGVDGTELEGNGNGIQQKIKRYI